MYTIENSIETFSFEHAVFQEVKTSLDGITVICNQVLISESNPYNKDIVPKRTNEFRLHFPKLMNIQLIEEGYSVYDADLKLIDQKHDRTVKNEDIYFDLEHMNGCEIDELYIENHLAVCVMLVEDHTWRLEIEFEGAYSCNWERFMSL